MNEKEIDEDVMEQLTDDEVEELTEQAQVEMFEPTPHHKEQEWEKMFIEKFFVYNLKENTPAGAEKEAIKFIHSLLAQQREAVEKMWKDRNGPPNINHNIGYNQALDDVLKVLN